MYRKRDPFVQTERCYASPEIGPSDSRPATGPIATTKYERLPYMSPVLPTWHFS